MNRIEWVEWRGEEREWVDGVWGWGKGLSLVLGWGG